MRQKDYSLFLLIFLIYIILSLNQVDSLKFGISPEKIILSGGLDKPICTNFHLTADNNLVFIGDIKWSKVSTRDIKNYNLSSQDLEILAVYPDKTGQGKKEICFSAKNGGKYFGVLLYRIEGTNYGIGTWIELNIEEGRFIKNSGEKINLITGHIVSSGNSLQSYLFIELFILLSLILIVLLIFVSKKITKRFIKSKIL